MPTDGDIDYQRFDRSQLEEALTRIDRSRFPINYHRLVFELERRRAEDEAKQTTDPAPATTPFQLQFKGDAREYFRIWIVNLALTIVTVGVYSAWAKVRKQRYFYANTYLAGSAFGYHAEPLRILKGRVIAALFVVAYFLALRTSAVATLAVIGAILLAMPWLIVKSRIFSARVTSWRGLRFNFKADYGGAYANLLGWLVLGVLTFGLLLPRLARERYRFIVIRSSYGSTPFNCNPSIGRFYTTAFAAGGLAIAVSLIVLPAVALVVHSLGFTTTAPGTANGMSLVSLFLNYAILGPVVLGYTHARNITEVLSHTTIGPNRFDANLGARKLIGIYMGNIFAIVGTLGMLTPWAQIRLARYRIEAVELHATDSLNQFAAQPANEVPSAISEELSSFFDLDFGF